MIDNKDKGVNMIDLSHQAVIVNNAVLLPTDMGDIEQTARSFKAMSHPLRLKILCILRDGERSVQGIVKMVDTSQSNVSQHLVIMRDEGILAARKDAKWVYYRVADNRTLHLIEVMHDIFCHRRN